MRTKALTMVSHRDWVDVDPPVQGQIVGIHTMAGVMIAKCNSTGTCLIRLGDGSTKIGHTNWFVKDKPIRQPKESTEPRKYKVHQSKLDELIAKLQGTAL